MKLLTPQCYNSLLAEIDNIKSVLMPDVAQEIAIARSHGDLRENAQYSSAKEKQRMIETRLQELENVISTHEVCDITKIQYTKVSFGATVKLHFLDDNSTKTFQILSDYDSNINNGTISINTPIAKAILGLEVEDEAEIKIGAKVKNVKISEIL